MKTKRCGIFVFYNEQGKVGKYVEVLLESLQIILNELIIVINGQIDFDKKENLCKYSNHVFQRDNIGYDAGAYKDVFTQFLKEKDWAQWDELLLINDTFYGPFYDWVEVFDEMESRKCDFWGLSCHPGGREMLFGGEIISPHVQSYFILIKKRMFTCRAFKLFWQNLKYPTYYKEAIKKFEIYFSEYFFDRGFLYESWLAVKTEYMGKSVVPGVGNMELLIKEWHFPILKKKACMLPDYISLKRLFNYLSEDIGYPVEIMREDLWQRSLEGKMEPYNPNEILKFCDQYENIYLFGMGNYAKNIEQFLMDNGKQICGYILSKVEKTQKQVCELEKFLPNLDRGVIVALNYKNFREVHEKIKQIIPLRQLLIPFYDY